MWNLFHLPFVLFRHPRLFLRRRLLFPPPVFCNVQQHCEPSFVSPPTKPASVVGYGPSCGTILGCWLRGYSLIRPIIRVGKEGCSSRRKVLKSYFFSISLYLKVFQGRGQGTYLAAASGSAIFKSAKKVKWTNDTVTRRLQKGAYITDQTSNLEPNFNRESERSKKSTSKFEV